jgi:nitrate/nitrite transporter NarK
VEGKPKKVKVEKTVPPEAVAALHSLDGKSFSSAKEFLKAATDAVGKEQVKPLEATLMRAARSDSFYWIAVWLIALGAASHQAWSANIFTLVSDVFPKKAIASVTGIGGMVGGVAGILADRSLGKVLSASGPSGYFFAFLIAGSCYLILLGVAHLLMPKMTPLDENLRRVES